MASWKEKKRTELKEKIYRTACAQFIKKGFEATSVDSLVAKIGIAKGTFFIYFPSKDSILSEWYRRVTLIALADVKERPRNSACKNILMLGDLLAAGGAETPQLFVAKTYNKSPIITYQEKELDADLIEFLHEQICSGIANNEFKEGIDASVFASIINSLLTGIGHEWVINNCEGNLLEVVETRLKFLLDSVSIKKIN